MSASASQSERSSSSFLSLSFIIESLMFLIRSPYVDSVDLVKASGVNPILCAKGFL